MPLKQQITEDMKTAMRAGDKARLAVIRLMLAAIKQQEIDQRIELDDTAVLAALDRMIKQRRESIRQYEAAARAELVAQEQFEIEVVQNYMPAPLSTDEVDALIAAALTESGAASVRDMGKVMAILKPQVQGRADVGQLSAQVKARLGG
ncbi:MAG: GatB/YqeY domain-containing protein [Thiothrix sp.]|nr:GatB/YqeY domain-containing protein [Thiothrix sp.]HPQ94858.1 GatB/YqeY domain-containing protein [Thiolinea sp.]